jgi:hypothetical protein
MIWRPFESGRRGRPPALYDYTLKTTALRRVRTLLRHTPQSHFGFSVMARALFSPPSLRGAEGDEAIQPRHGKNWIASAADAASQ